jgi:hypothetical protein
VSDDSFVEDVTKLSLSTNPSIDSLKEANLDWLPHSFFIYPNIIRSLHSNQGIHYDEKTKENYVLVPFGAVDKFVPHDLYSQVQQDNQMFLAEKQVICNAFFKTTAFLLQQVVKQTDEIENLEIKNAKLSKVFGIVDKIIFEMIANGSE